MLLSAKSVCVLETSFISPFVVFVLFSLYYDLLFMAHDGMIYLFKSVRLQFSSTQLR